MALSVFPKVIQTFLFNFLFLEYNREYKLGKRLYMICGGEPGDMDSFATWAKANIDLYERRNGWSYVVYDRNLSEYRSLFDLLFFVKVMKYVLMQCNIGYECQWLKIFVLRICGV